MLEAVLIFVRLSECFTHRGAGFGFAKMRGSEANDPFRVDENGRIFTETNHNGGINGGISNGMPILFRCAFKPTPSIGWEQQTVDLTTMEMTLVADNDLGTDLVAMAIDKDGQIYASNTAGTLYAMDKHTGKLTEGILKLDYIIEIRGARAERCEMTMRIKPDEE